MTASPSVWATALAVAAIAATALTWGPRRLLAAIGEIRPLRWQEAALFAAMVASALVATAVAGRNDIEQAGIVALAAACAVAVIYYDLRYMIVPDLASAGFAIAGIVAIQASGRWLEHVLGAAACGGMLAAVAFGFRALRGHDGLGLGDVKLAGGLGLLIGLENGLWTVAAASLCGAVWAAVRTRRLSAAGEEATATIPLGALLAFIGSGLYLCRP